MKHDESFVSLKGPKTPGGNPFARFYTGSAFIILNTLIFLVLVNLILGVAFWTYDRYRLAKKYPTAKPRANAFFYEDGTPVDNGKRSRYQLDLYDFPAGEGINPEEAAAVLDDFFRLTQDWFIYQPWVQFSEGFFRSKHVNVLRDDARFPRRYTENPDNPHKLPEIVVWTLGGSTTFGYQVADQQTWPSYLSQALNERARQDRPGVQVRVENYGRASYTPGQEAILLWDLLSSGQRPSLVVFMDGINMGGAENYPDNTSQLDKMFRIVQQERFYPWLWAESLRISPMGRLARSLWEKLWPPDQAAPAPHITEEQQVRWICNRFRESWKLAGELCRCYGAELLVCLQPTPYYHYALKVSRVPENDLERAYRRRTARLYTNLRRKTDCLYLGDLYGAWGPRRKAFLDDVHYTPGFNKFLAENLASHIDLKKLYVSPGYLPQEATGAPRPQDLGQDF